ncbi:mRNA turnover protein 4 homolog [Culicoides brevitarsis]|uniref:mRNA turnover protein 4 homolog n=1 Tax=Culicoides brevitarsis TaxID=469753 RepID=UPI00307B774F
MPRSKRDKKISLTKTDKKGVGMKQQIIEDIQSCCTKYDNIFLFSVENMRNAKLKEVRTEWKDSRFFFGKNRVMQVGLKNFIDNDDADQIKTLNELTDRLTGQCGLLFTNRARDTVLEWFDNYSESDYARSGFKATETVLLPAGPLPEFSHAMEPHLRTVLGMPTKLEKGIVTLYKEFLVCKEGQVLTPEQAKILKLVSKQMAEFRLNIECCWIKDSGFEVIKERPNANGKVAKKKAPKKKKDKKKGKKVEKNDENEEMEKEDGEEAMDQDDSD